MASRESVWQRPPVFVLEVACQFLSVPHLLALGSTSRFHRQRVGQMRLVTVACQCTKESMAFLRGRDLGLAQTLDFRSAKVTAYCSLRLVRYVAARGTDRLRSLILQDGACPRGHLLEAPDAARVAAACRNLRHVATGNELQLTDAGLEALCGLRSLENLDACFLHVTSFRPLLAVAATLKCLHVMGCYSVRLHGLAPLASLTHLNCLSVFGCKDAQLDANLGLLRNLASLTCLSLMDCGLSGRGLRHLSLLCQLDTLFLSDNPLTDRGLSELPGTIPLAPVDRLDPSHQHGCRVLEPHLSLPDRAVRQRPQSRHGGSFQVQVHGVAPPAPQSVLPRGRGLAPTEATGSQDRGLRHLLAAQT